MKHIIITGASRGIGAAVAGKFLKLPDVTLYLLARSAAKMKNLYKQYPNVNIISVDITNASKIETIFKEIYSKTNHVDFLINCAASLIRKPFKEFSYEEVYELYNINLFSQIHLIKNLINKNDEKKRAHIVNISSMSGFQGSSKFPGLSIYGSTKGALNILTECLAEEFKDTKIHFNALCLGAVQTDMLSQAFPGYKAPLKPEEIAEFICDFALNGYKFFNGRILPVNLSTP